MVGHSPVPWAEVGRRIRERIDELNLTKAEVIRLSGVSAKTLDGYLAGNPIRRRDKERDLAQALRWTPDSVRRILSGGEPVWVAHRVIRHDVDLSDISNAHEFVHEHSVPADQLDESSVVVQSRGEEERILPDWMEERFEALEAEVAALKAELAAERDRSVHTPEERDPATVAQFPSPPPDPWHDLVPDEDDEDEAGLWALDLIPEGTRQQWIWELRNRRATPPDEQARPRRRSNG